MGSYNTFVEAKMAARRAGGCVFIPVQKEIDEVK
jgi:hypothetical protein